MKKIFFAFMLLLAGLELYAQNSLLENIGFEFVDIPGTDLSMSTTEVTQELYEAVMGENPSYNKGSKNPVERVSWYDAIYFCNKLSEICGLTPVYAINGADVSKWSWYYIPHKGESVWEVKQETSANGFRLPEWWEWRYAALGGENYTYSGGDNLDEVAWFCENSDDCTHPVAQKKANGYGLYDMSGNVWEWVWDVSRHYSTHRLICGGCYGDLDKYCQVDWLYTNACEQIGGHGFRIVRSTSN